MSLRDFFAQLKRRKVYKGRAITAAIDCSPSLDQHRTGDFLPRLRQRKLV
jgi:hypothetical protein